MEPVDLEGKPNFVTYFNEVADLHHRAMVGKKFWEKPVEDGTRIALMHGELSEAMEALRRKPQELCPCGVEFRKHAQYPSGEVTCLDGHAFPVHPSLASDHIPEFLGVEEEMADVILRIMDLSVARGWRVAEAMLAKMSYNAGRPERHGKAY